MDYVVELADSELTAVVGGNATVFGGVYTAPVGVSSVRMEVNDRIGLAAVAVSGSATASSPDLAAISSTVAISVLS